MPDPSFGHISDKHLHFPLGHTDIDQRNRATDRDPSHRKQCTPVVPCQVADRIPSGDGKTFNQSAEITFHVRIASTGSSLLILRAGQSDARTDVTHTAPTPPATSLSFRMGNIFMLRLIPVSYTHLTLPTKRIV